jgi:D-alanine-D-alanine ligase
MTIKVEKDWWKTLFDEVYLQTDARSVCDEELTRQEVDFLIRKLGLLKTDPILDLCGGHGRHALEFSRQGFQRVVLLDYSASLLNHGHHAARLSKLDTAFIQGDARRPGLKDQTFKAVLIMGCSFGYFIDDVENCKILEGVHRMLRPSGHVLLDLPNREYVIKHFTPEIRHKADHGLEVIRKRELKDNTIYAREKVVSSIHGLIRINNYCTRLYDLNEITRLLVENGFGDIHSESDFMDRSDRGNYGSMTRRMVVMARKT